MKDFIPINLKEKQTIAIESITVQTWSYNNINVKTNAFGMVTEGQATITDVFGSIILTTGMYFVVKQATIMGGQGLLVEIENEPVYRQFGGPLESTGRLQYIDGCSDTLLVCPPKLGQACLNHLHIPAFTDQSQHTHPSIRVGVIMQGEGQCKTPGKSHNLTAGMGWIIPTGCKHSFYTKTQALDVVAWHPDSDFGPMDENHPMINRTIL